MGFSEGQRVAVRCSERQWGSVSGSGGSEGQ